MKRNHKTVENVYKEIKRMIYLNLLAPGQKLVCQDLAKKLQTSTTPVVQALRGLERSNLVRHEHNRGYFVQEITIREAEELFQAREALEIFLIPVIIQNLNRDRLESIRQAIKDYQNGLGTEPRRMLMHKEFRVHLKIVECAGNKVIHCFLENVLEQIALRYNPDYLWEYRIKEASKEHWEVFEALSKGNVAETQEHMRSHIRNCRNHIIGSLKALRNFEI